MPRPASAGRCASNCASPASGSSAETRRKQVDDGRLVDVGPLARGLRVARSGLLEPLARAVEDAAGLPRDDRAVGDQLGRQVDEVARDRHVFLVRPLLDVGGRAARLARRLQVAALELGKRALREHGEARDALDLVAEQLDAHGLGSRGREDVDDVAAHRELAAIADALDALVAGRDERRDGVVALELSPALDVQRRRPARRAAGCARPARPPRPRPARPSSAVRARVRARPRGAGRARGPSRRRRRATAGIRPRTAARTSSPRRPARARSRRRRRGPPVPAAPRPGGASRARRAAGEQRLRNARTRRQRRVERARELRDAGLRGDLLRDGGRDRRG